MERIIFHIDVNSAFLSWSAIKLLSEGFQDIRLLPSVVSGDPDDRRSIVTAKSIPAKKLGIDSAEPLSMAMRKCPDLIIVKGDRDWYRECSRAFMDICRSYSPVVQKFSIDECFLDMTFRLYGKEPTELALKLKDEIREKLGFTVNVGIGPNKLLAKMASDFEKPDRVHTLWKDEIAEKMWVLPVRNLLWVGRKSEEKLRNCGIETIGELAHLGLDSLKNLFGAKYALQLHENANGIDNTPVETEAAEAKSYSVERTFEKDISDPKALDRILFDEACILARRIRKDSFRASCVSLFIKYPDFSLSSRQQRTEQPTDLTALILFAARDLLKQLWDGRTPLRQIGMGLSALTHEKAYQMSLFEDRDLEYYKRWDREYDRKMAK